jgi:hypothetical protein
MFISFLGGTAAPAQTGPTALLKLIAGEFAGRIAAVWPEPHAAFLTAPATRRHLACLALATGADLPALAPSLLGGRLRDAVRRVARTPGLERALGRLGETAWSAAAYRKLLDLLADPAAAKRLRHAEAIDPGAVARLDRLPGAMRLALHLAELITDDAAEAVTECCGVIAFRFGDAAAEAAAGRWAMAATEAALFEAIRDELLPEPPPPPHPGTARLKPLATKAALRDAARRFGNCLANRVAHAVGGFSAYYEWTEAPGAVVEVSRDAIFGWRLEEAKGPGNAVLDRDVREALTDELALMGVYVGRSGWQLERALSADLGRTWRLATVAEDLADVFGD